MDNKYVISLEIGSSAVQVVAAAYDPVEPGPLTIVGAAEAPLVNCVRYGRVQNVKQVAKQTLMALDSLRQYPELADRELVGVYSALGGRSLHSLTAEASLTFPDETCVTDEIIDRLKDQAVDGVEEDVEIYEVTPVSYTVDGMAAANPVGVYVREIKARFTLVVCKSMNFRNLERVLVEQLGLEICGTIVRPLAIADLCLTRDDTRPGCMLVDVGAETTTVSIYREGALIYLATIPLGGAHITRDIAGARGITEEQAEATKCNMASAMIDASAPNAEIRDINNHAHARAIEIVANILAQIEYAGLTPSHIRAGIIITGRGARLRNFSKLLEAQSGMKVRAAAIPGTVRMASADLKAADLLAPIAVAAVAARLADDPAAIPCLTEPVFIPAAEDDVVEEETVETDDNITWTPEPPLLPHRPRRPRPLRSPSSPSPSPSLKSRPLPPLPYSPVPSSPDAAPGPASSTASASTTKTPICSKTTKWPSARNRRHATRKSRPVSARPSASPPNAPPTRRRSAAPTARPRKRPRAWPHAAPRRTPFAAARPRNTPTNPTTSSSPTQLPNQPSSTNSAAALPSSSTT